MRLDVIALGTAQDGGWPQLGGPATAVERTAASLLIRSHAESLLVDASPDLRVQYAALLQADLIDEPLGGIVLTHAHIGHYAGLVHFGKEAMAAPTTPVWATPSMLDYLASNQPWRALFEEGFLEARQLSPGVPTEVLPGLELRFHTVPHRAEFSDTVGVSIGGLLYLPDIDSWEAWPDASRVVGEHELAFLDGTFWSAEELPERDLAEIPHPLVPDTLERFAGLGTRVVLTHLNHSNPAGVPGSEAEAVVKAAGVEVAFDMAVYET